jgi:anti-sigma B factor antagonist
VAQARGICGHSPRPYGPPSCAVSRPLRGRRFLAGLRSGADVNQLESGAEATRDGGADATVIDDVASGDLPVFPGTAVAHMGPSPGPLCIEGELTFHRAMELRDTLLAFLECQASPIDIDLSGVSALDTAGVQLLLLAKSTASASNRELRLVGQSGAVVQTFELLNLTTHFGGPAFFLF